MTLPGMFEVPSVRLARLRTALGSTAQGLEKTVGDALDLEDRRRAMEDSLRRFREVDRQRPALFQGPTLPTPSPFDTLFEETGITRGMKAQREREVRAVQPSRLTFEPSPSPTGRFVDRIAEQPESVRQFQSQFPGEDVPGTVPQPISTPIREPGIPSLIEDVFRQVGRVAGGPEMEEAFLPENVGGLAPPIPEQLVDVETRAAGRYAELLEETRQSFPAATPPGTTHESLALERLDEEMGEELRASQPQEGKGLFGKLLSAGLKGLEMQVFGRPGGAAEALETVGKGVRFLETEPTGGIIGGPFFRDPRTETTAFERGAEISRPAVQAAQPVAAEPFEQVEAAGIPIVSPAAGGISTAIQSQIVEDIATELINPAALVLIAPIVMQGTQGLRGAALAAQMSSNLLGTGLEPALVRGTLRGFTLLGTRGTAALRTIPQAIRETPTFRRALKGIREAGEAGARPLGGDDLRPFIKMAKDEGLVDAEAVLRRAEEIAAGQGRGPLRGGEELGGFPERFAGKARKLEGGPPFQRPVTRGRRLAGDIVQGIPEPPRLTGPHQLKPAERDVVGAAFERLSGAPDTPVPITTRRNLPTVQAFDDQVESAIRFRDQARESLKFTKRSVRDGVVSPNRLGQAEKTLDRARRQLVKAKDAQRAAQIRATREDVVRTAAAASLDDEAAGIVGRFFDDSVKLVPAEESLLTAASWRQWLARLSGMATGTPPGAVGQLSHMRASLREALGRHVEETFFPIFRRVGKLLDAELDNITYVGPKKWADDAVGEFKAFHIVQHPDWFKGMSPELKGVLIDAQLKMRSRLEIARAMGYPIEGLDGAYLEQLWEIPRTQLSTGVPRISGKVSVARTRLFDDYLVGIRQGFTPKDLTVEELMQHSSSLLNEAVADAWLRQETLRRFGTKGVRKATSGQRAFGHPLYRGWSGPTDVTNWIDQLHNPTGFGVRSTQNVAAALKNTVFGLADIAVGGVQFPLTVAHGGLQLGVGALNRSLQALGLPFMHIYLQDPAIASRVVQMAADGVHVGIGPSSVRLGAGTIIKYIPVAGKPIDKVLSKGIDFLAQVQFGHALTSLRMRLHEGNLIALKMTGKDITNPAVRRMSAEWANAGTGASRGAATPGRRVVETVGLTSFQMTRANIAVYAQLIKSLGPKASAAERLRAALVLANLAAYVYGIQYLVNGVFGDGPMEWRPGRPDWGTIRVGGTTIPILPQRTLLRAIDKSLKAIERGEPGGIAQAWAQVAVGKSAPIVQAPLALAGFGFEPGTGQFEPGTLSALGRLEGAAPVPPIVEQAIFQERDVLSLGLAGIGFNPYPTSPHSLLKEGFAEKTERDFNPEVDYIVSDADPELSGLVDAATTSSAERGSQGALRQQKSESFRAELESELGLDRLAAAFLSGEANGSRIIKLWGEYQDRMSGAISFAVFGDDRQAKTPEGKALKAWAELRSTDPRFLDAATGEIDYVTYTTEKDRLFEVIEDLYPALARALEDRIRSVTPDLQRVEPLIKEAFDLRSQLFDIPKHRDVTTEEEQQVKDLRRLVDQARDRIAGSGLDPGDVTLALYQAVAKDEGIDAKFAFLGFGLRPNSQSEISLRDVAYTQFLLANAEALGRFFPDLYGSRQILPVLSPEIREAVIAGSR